MACLRRTLLFYLYLLMRTSMKPAGSVNILGVNKLSLQMHLPITKRCTYCTCIISQRNSRKLCGKWKQPLFSTALQPNVWLIGSVAINPYRAQCVAWFIKRNWIHRSKGVSERGIARCHRRKHRYVFGTNNLRRSEVYCTGDVLAAHMCLTKLPETYVR